ncbi:hypothetical protein GKC30_07955 [Pseudodesulfovibrio sp. F-1]|uniref:Uncharacterized protein n=1 Tax=Pseudodesulfovibrio alkaliphilus TaxID=2661613 RepID=A0A7K1KNU3_9BACT|nr:hypothetical protein [Pseudodesulfovibrio alkaliphilus]MUM77562.1 hypothetical protein [Pseudodesulfovibrio alkaliphilus]
MSMECDTRLAMMAMQRRAENSARAAHISRRRRTRIRRAGEAVSAGVAAFALTLFTRGF